MDEFWWQTMIATACSAFLAYSVLEVFLSIVRRKLAILESSIDAIADNVAEIRWSLEDNGEEPAPPATIPIHQSEPPADNAAPSSAAEAWGNTW
jgi:hypothetical protein